MYGAFGNEENKRRTNQNRVGGIGLRTQPNGGGSATIRPDYRGTQAARLRQRKNPAQAPTAPEVLGSGLAAPNNRRGPAPQPWQAYETPPSGISQADMLTEQRRGFGGAGDIVAEQNQMNMPGDAPQAEQVGPGIYRSGNSYADTAEGAAGGGTTAGGVFSGNTGMAVGSSAGGFGGGSNFAANAYGGPFGRTPQEQTAIENRVGEIQRATDFIRSMRDIPTERDRLKQQAGQYVSLNQGLGAFLNQGSQRNYARDRLKDLEANDLSKDKLAQANAQNQFDNMIAQQKLQQGAFSTDTIQLPDGREVPMITDNRLGTVSYGEPPTPQLSPEQAQTQFTREADKMESDAKFMTAEKDIFGNMTREEWIAKKVAEASGQTAPTQAGAPGQQVGKSGNPKEQWFKGSDGKAKRYVVEDGKWVQRDA